jgi:hypothetical protein
MNPPLHITHTLVVRNNEVMLDGRLFFRSSETTSAAFFTALYRHLEISYPKFFKMDNLCKLGFLAAEIILGEASVKQRYRDDEVGMVLFNAASSIDTDRNHQVSIANRDNYFPSPSVFVYTLANIIIGEISIRHKLTGESCFFIEQDFQPDTFYSQVSLFMENEFTRCGLAGRVELDGPLYEAFFCFIEGPVDTKGIAIFEPGEINKLYLLRN